MRILQLTQRFPPALGGVENHVWHLARGLAEGGDDVEVSTTDLRTDIPLQRLGREREGFPYPVHRSRARRMAVLPHAIGNVAPAMLRHVLSGRWDVVHAHAYGYFPTFAAAVGRLLNRSSLVITPHSDPGRGTWGKRAFDAVAPLLTLRRAERVIALTNREARYLETLGVATERIAVIPNGVDRAEFVPRSSRGTGLADGVTVLFAGRCYPQQKGLEVLVRAASCFPPKSGMHIRIVGEDWGGQAVVTEMAKELGIADRVSVLGRLDRPHLIEEFLEADIFVLPSLFDSFPIGILEAMAAGLPVVATRVGGVPDVVQDGQTGLLVEPGDARALAAALERLAADPGTRKEMGRRGRERARLYSWEETLARTRGVYQQAVVARGS